VAVKCPKCEFDNTADSKFCKECGTQLIPSEGPRSSKTLTLETQAEGLTRGIVFAGRYEILEELGTGGMGSVYRVFDRKLEEEVALKLIRPDITASRKTIERFKNELKVARKITHPNVCRMHDLHEDEKILYITMEYVHGEDLRSVIHRMGTLTMGKAISITQQVAEGLAAAHKLGIIHRDLKPGNIMVDKDGNAKIMDFGIARILAATGTTAEGAMIGTPEYMSPEQVEGKPADARSDLYALGVILFEMVTGQAPFEGDTPLSIAHKHRYEPPPDPQKLNAHIPGGLNRIILRLLEKDKEKRYQTTEELLQDLAAAEEALPKAERIIPKRRPSISRYITVKFNLKKLLIPALLIIFLAIIGILIWKPPLTKEAPAAPKIKNSIAVISFENLTGEPQYDSLTKAVPSLFTTKFEAMGFSYVPTWERLQDILKQLGKDPETPIDAETGFAICQKEGIEALLVGKITRAGNVFALDAKALDVGTRRSLASETSRGEGEDSILLSQIDDISSGLASKLNVKTLAAEAVPPIAETTTSSLKAYEYYLKGNEAIYRGLGFDEARDYFLKAVEIDPGFVLAHLGIAQTYRQQGNQRGAREVMEKAMAYSERANPKERLYLQAWFARIVEGDRKKLVQIMKEIAQKYPKEKEAHYWLGVNYKADGMFDEAIREFQTVLELDPYSIIGLAEITGAYVYKRDFENALAAAKRHAALAPNEASPLEALGYTYMQMGQLDLAIEKYKEALAIKPDFAAVLGGIVNTYGLKEDYSEAIKWANEKIVRSKAPAAEADGHLLRGFYEYWTGSFRQAVATARKVREIGESAQNMHIVVWALLLEGLAHLDQEHFQLASENFIKAGDIFLKIRPDIPLIHEANKEYLLGLAEISQGKIEAVRKRLVTIERLHSESKDEAQLNYIDYLGKILRGEVSIAAGSFDDAIAIFNGLPFHFIEAPYMIYLEGCVAVGANLYQPEIALSRAYELKGEIGKAISVLEKLTIFDEKRGYHIRLTHPKVYYHLGRLYEKTGLKEKAEQYYQKFLDLWKNADPRLPEVEDARKRLAGLSE
jgi:tetratricopeptide (TPR) repeat protein/predicted Ser/Thr protein kinase